MSLDTELYRFTERATLLQEFLDSDDILKMTAEELLLLENMQKGLEAYCTVLKIKLRKQSSIIRLKDKRENHG